MDQGLLPQEEPERLRDPVRQLVDLGGRGPRQEGPHRFLGPDGQLHRPGGLLGGQLALDGGPPPCQKFVLDLLALELQAGELRKLELQAAATALEVRCSASKMKSAETPSGITSSTRSVQWSAAYWS